MRVGEKFDRGYWKSILPAAGFGSSGSFAGGILDCRRDKKDFCGGIKHTRFKRFGAGGGRREVEGRAILLAENRRTVCDGNQAIEFFEICLKPKQPAKARTQVALLQHRTQTRRKNNITPMSIIKNRF